MQKPSASNTSNTEEAFFTDAGDYFLHNFTYFTEA